MIAEQLGISTATVDRALNNRKGVSQKTLTKVHEKAKELQYSPNRAAKFMSTQKMQMIAFLLPVIPSYFWGGLETEIKQCAKIYEEFGIAVEVHRVHTSPTNKMIPYMEELIEANEYAAIVMAPHDAAPYVDVINTATSRGIPVFTVNTDVPNSQRIAYVGSDYYEAGYLAAELIYLFNRDLRKVAVIRDEEDTFQMLHKQKGFLEYFEQNQIKVDIEMINMQQGLYTEKEQLKELIESPELYRFDAIYVASGILGEVDEYWLDWAKSHIIVGHDINQEIYNQMQKGIITATICQDPMAQATIVLQKVTEYLSNSKSNKVNDHIVKLEIATRANAKYYM
nr:LacI family DNA-binding transcriptional regulator [Gracilibacillus alcaliphilus]